MRQPDALAELVRRFPNADAFGARETATLPNNPGWRCTLSAYYSDDGVYHFGRGETFEAAFDDMERRDGVRAHRAHPRPLDPIAEAFMDLPPGGGS